MKKTVSIMFAALIFATSATALFGQGAAAADKLASGSYVVYARSPQVWRFTVDAKMANAAVVGHFIISDGMPKDIQVLVLDEDNFRKWSSEVEATHNSAKPLFDSGRKAQGDLNVKITQPGNYYIAFSDMYQYEGTKALTADVKLQYDKK